MENSCCATNETCNNTSKEEVLDKEVAGCYFDHIKPSECAGSEIALIREDMKFALKNVLRKLPANNRWRSEFKTCMETALMYATKCVCVADVTQQN